MSTTETVYSLEANRLETNLADQRRQLRANPANRALELDIADGDERVRRLRRDHAAHVRVEQERAADATKRDADARTELEQRLMDEYRQAAPGTTAAEAQVALPDLLRRHRIAELDRRDAALVEAKRRIGAF